MCLCKMHILFSGKIDENLNWREHTNKLLLKLNANMNLLKVGRNCSSRHALKAIYFAQIQSNMSYGIGIWGSLIPKETLTKLQKIQNMCLKILDSGRYAGNKDNDPIQILTVEQLIHLELCKIWHKRSLGLLPTNLESTMSTDQYNKNLHKSHRYHTRRKNLQNRPRSTHHQYHDSFLVKGNCLYCQLSQDLHEIKSIKQFNTALKKTLVLTKTSLN